MGVVKHSESTQSNKFAISLQHFKREVRDGTYFLHADKHQGFYELTLKFLMEVVMHAQSAQNRKLVIFLQHIEEKSITAAFVFCCDAKHSDILWGSSHVCSYSLFGKFCKV